MNLDAATEAVKHKLGTTWPEPTLTEISREIAEAAAPHILQAAIENERVAWVEKQQEYRRWRNVRAPLGYTVIDAEDRLKTRRPFYEWEAKDRLRYLRENEPADGPYRLVALVPVDKS